MLFPDPRFSQRCPGVGCSRKEIYRRLHDGPNATRVRVHVLLTYFAYSPSNRLKCDESSEEMATTSTENVLKIECNISGTTNFMQSGIMEVSQVLPHLYAYLNNKSCLPVSRSKSLQAVADAEPRSRIQPKLPPRTSPNLPHSSHGPFRMAT